MKDLIPMDTEADTVAIEVGQNAIKGLPAVPVSLYLLGDLAGEEKISVQYFAGNDWKTVKENGNEVVLDVNTNQVTIYGPFEGRIRKPATTYPAGVAISSVMGV
jgi:hypothetical protein